MINERAGTWFRRPDGSEMRFRVTYRFGGTLRTLIDEAPADGGTWKPFMRIDCARADEPGGGDQAPERNTRRSHA